MQLVVLLEVFDALFYIVGVLLLVLQVALDGLAVLFDLFQLQGVDGGLGELQVVFLATLFQGLLSLLGQ